nr:DNA-binding protein [Mycobacterium malmoense]
MNKNPADYVIGPEATIEDADLDEREIYYKGERLTEARVAELGDIAAKEAEQTRAARAANLIPGGKSLSGGQKHSPVVQVRVSEATRDKLAAIAKARKMSVSKLSRQVLDEFVKQAAR